MKAEIKNIVFDLGGVLIDWNPRHLYNAIFHKEEDLDFFLGNICTMEWNLEQDAGRPLHIGTEILVNQYPHFEKEIRLFYKKWHKMLGGPITENVRLLRPLKQSYRLFALTNWSAETFPYAWEKYTFLQDFEGILMSGEEKLVKPDPRIYQLFLEKFNVQASSCLFIDDNPENIKAAKKEGFETIHFTDEINLADELTKKGILPG